MTLSSYPVEDVHLQDTLLDAVAVAVDEIIAASRELIPVLVAIGALRHRQRMYNTAMVIHRVTVLGLAPRSYLPRTTRSTGDAMWPWGRRERCGARRVRALPDSERTSVADVDTALPHGKRLRIATFDDNSRRHRERTDRWRGIVFTVGSLRCRSTRQIGTRDLATSSPAS